jgi:hypothetical protein
VEEKYQLERFGTGNENAIVAEGTGCLTSTKNELKVEPVSEGFNKENQASTRVCSDRSYDEKSKQQEPHRKTSDLD